MEETKYKIAMPKQALILTRIGHIAAALYVAGVLSIYIWREPLVALMTNDLNAREAQIPLVHIIQVGLLVIINAYVGWSMVRQQAKELTLARSSRSLWSVFGIFVTMLIMQRPISLIAIVGRGTEAIALLSIMGSFVEFINWLYTTSWLCIMIGFGIRHGWLLCKSRVS